MTKQITRRQHERVLLSDCFTTLRNDGQSIRVHVLRKTDVATVSAYYRTEGAEIFGDRLCATWKESIRSNVDWHDFDTECLEKTRGHNGSGTVTGINRH